tara:strand:- start:4093 stop:5502 length:1410 start_codon:yes stop_codon:yes gene_type:complete
MPYIGNPAVVGDSANTFKLLDDIASYTLTFDGSSASVVSVANDTLTFNNHRFVNIQRVTYTKGGGTVITGLTDNTAYYVIKVDQNTIKLATSSSNAEAGTGINLTGLGAGTTHTLNAAFDGTNTKFKATHSNGTKAKISRAAQLTISINGVNQQPQESSAPTVGYGIAADSTIVFSQAPVSTDKVFGTFIGEVAPSFDITDNTIDEFTANGSTTTFTLSKEATASRDVLVTLDGVTQYPSTQSDTRAYSIADNSLIFTTAPAAGVVIQARHIAFAGSSTSNVSAFYGRTGNVTLKSTDNISVNNITAAGDLNITGDITYDEVVGRNLEITGIATVASGIVSTGDFKVGSATTISQDNIFTTGIVTAMSGFNVGIMSGGVTQTVGVITAINFIGVGNTLSYNASTSTIDVSISSGGAVGAGTDRIFFENDQTVQNNYTVSAGKNAMTAGPVAIAANKTVTIPSGSEWSIV